MANILNIIAQPVKQVATGVMSVISQPVVQPPVEPKSYYIRNNKITEDDLEEAKAILFGEISNRTSDKQMLEARTILNTAFNRLDNPVRNDSPRNLKGVLQEPNQYQAFGGKQYNKFKAGQFDDLDKRKIDSINKVIDEVRGGNFQNNIGDYRFYTHKPDGRIIATQSY